MSCKHTSAKVSATKRAERKTIVCPFREFHFIKNDVEADRGTSYLGIGSARNGGLGKS
jgi:hypothetical protein